ncbi:hypothetical protein LCGC14_1657480 [marine sediment metagenome]|uniref:Uncharacterized protein n=1 Tax=marine sediment metagenome TaxID=412755 RepID=A0A0F9HV26_9ZZZZ
MIEAGKLINHKRYGKAMIIRKVWKKERGKFGVLLNLLTKEGKAQFRLDRRGILPRCYEANLNFIENV